MTDALDTLRQALGAYHDPYLGQTLLEARAVRGFEQRDGRLHVALELGIPVGDYGEELRAALEAHLASAGVAHEPLELRLSGTIVAHGVQRNLKPLPGVSNIVAVASGKGGVGKSTVAVNLAVAWAAAGARVGLLDADIYGPSQPLMLGLSGQHPASPDGKHIEPLLAHGVKAMSIGFLVEVDQALAWRGPMVTSALSQLLADTNWGELDYLVVDMPPGTGDIQLTLSQRVPVSGAVVVTTPQDIALADAARGVAMFEKVAIPVLGIVENMSVHICSQCGHAEHLFGAGGGARLAAERGVELLGELPLEAAIRAEADGGRPSVVSAPGTPRAQAFERMARRVAGALTRQRRDSSSLFPKIVVE